MDQGLWTEGVCCDVVDLLYGWPDGESCGGPGDETMKLPAMTDGGDESSGLQGVSIIREAGLMGSCLATKLRFIRRSLGARYDWHSRLIIIIVIGQAPMCLHEWDWFFASETMHNPVIFGPSQLSRIYPISLSKARTPSFQNA